MPSRSASRRRRVVIQLRPEEETDGRDGLGRGAERGQQEGRPRSEVGSPSRLDGLFHSGGLGGHSPADSRVTRDGLEMSDSRARLIQSLFPQPSRGPVSGELVRPAARLEDWLRDEPVGPVEVTVRKVGDETSAPVRLERPITFLGRDERCDVRLEHPDVSARHVFLQRLGGRFLFIDLGSRGGVYRNGTRETFGWFGAGDRLDVGPFRLERAEADQAADEAPEFPVEELFRRKPADDEFPALALRFRNPPCRRSPSEIAIDRPMTLVGRSKICKVRLCDGSVSRVEVNLILTRRGVLAIDLLGRGGLTVNGRRESQFLLNAGDRMRVGRFEAELVERGRPVPAAPSVVMGPMQVPTGVSEGFALALVGMLGDLQRQVQEQSGRQFEMMAQLVTSLRNEWAEERRELAAELARLRELTAEILDVQRQLLERDRSAGPAPVGTTLAFDPAPVEPSANSAAELPVGPLAAVRRGPPSAGNPAGRRPPSGVGLGDHVWLSERLRRLEDERSSLWQRLMRVVGVGDG